jgi:hypothetical protein
MAPILVKSLQTESGEELITSANPEGYVSVKLKEDEETPPPEVVKAQRILGYGGPLAIQTESHGLLKANSGDVVYDLSDGTRWVLPEPLGKALLVAMPDPPTVATGADAGAPGTFTPTGAPPPQDLAALASVTANPTTAWTTGQFVSLGDGSSATWDGTAWISGVSALAAPPQAPAASMGAPTSGGFNLE